MYGNGAMTGTLVIIMVPVPIPIHLGRPVVRIGWFAAARGTSVPRIAGSRSAAATRRPVGATATDFD